MGNNKFLEITKLMNQAGINPDCLSFDECIKEISSHDCRIEKLGKGAVFAPFPYFGGKRTVAPIVWKFFGAEVDNYIEPFAGGASVLFGRPNPLLTVQKRYTETINDKDAFVINAWRAMKYAAPRRLAAAVEIINSQQHLDALHQKLIYQYRLLNRMIRNDEKSFNLSLAAYWIAGIKHSIGAGFAIPDAYRRKISPRVSISGWPLGSAEACMNFFNYRLKHVNLMCGDWLSMIESRTRTTIQGTTAIFIDPPYPDGIRAPCYREDSGKVSDVAANWAIKTIDNDTKNKFRIAFCGYQHIYGQLFKTAGWDIYPWKGRGYALMGNGVGRFNIEQEAIWFSPVRG